MGPHPVSQHSGPPSCLNPTPDTPPAGTFSCLPLPLGEAHLKPLPKLPIGGILQILKPPLNLRSTA